MLESTTLFFLVKMLAFLGGMGSDASSKHGKHPQMNKRVGIYAKDEITNCGRR